MELAKATKNTKKTAVAPTGVKRVAKKSAPIAQGVGRRKSAVARAWLRRGTGKFLVNGREHTTYFDTDVARLQANQPFIAIPQAAQLYDIEINVVGGGLHGQAGATQVAIARALVAHDEINRVVLRQHGLLTVDSRLKERKKFGRKAARRRFQFVKR